jgi:hypothetical protein
MVHLPTLEAQRDFYDKNIKHLLRQFPDGYVVYYDGPHDGYKHYKTKNELKKAYPELFDETLRFGTIPLLIDITEEQFKRRNADSQDAERDMHGSMLTAMLTMTAASSKPSKELPGYRHSF